ncbi:MAG: YkvA family protein [Elainellaceae cyanobacterium]
MGNWFNIALKSASGTASNIGKNLSETASSLAKTIQERFPFSDDDTLTFFAVLFAVAAADGEIDEDELSMIMSSPEVDKLSAEGKKKLQTYSCNPPSVEEAIKKLSKANQELKFGLIFYILNLVWVDGVMTPGEERAIEIAQKELEINKVQLKAIKEFVNVLAKTRSEQNQETIEEVKAATERMKKVGVPIEALAHSQSDAEDLEYSDDKFLKKMKEFGTQAGKGLVEQAFIMWYVLHDPNTPTHAKLTIAGALAYWILPIDMVPDILPAIGFTDDLSIIATALAGIAMSITPEIRDKAKQQTKALFGGQEILESETIDVNSEKIA